MRPIAFVIAALLTATAASAEPGVFAEGEAGPACQVDPGSPSTCLAVEFVEVDDRARSGHSWSLTACAADLPATLRYTVATLSGLPLRQTVDLAPYSCYSDFGASSGVGVDCVVLYASLTAVGSVPSIAHVADCGAFAAPSQNGVSESADDALP